MKIIVSSDTYVATKPWSRSNDIGITKSFSLHVKSKVG